MPRQNRKSQPVEELLVSVIIPTYGRPDRLSQLLAQLSVQETDSFSYEIIVVDDGSPEPVGAIVQAASNQTKAPMRYLRQENSGPAAARNFGAQTACGEYLLFVDDDTLLSPDFIRGHLETQWQYGPALVNCKAERRINMEPIPFDRWYKRQVSAWEQSRWEGLVSVAEDVFEISNPEVTSANLSVRRVDFERAGGFDTNYPFGCEDQDFGARLGRSGMRTLLTCKTVAMHAETHTTFKLLCQRQRIGARDTVRFVRRFSVERNCGEPPIATVNNPIRLGVDPWSLIAKKLVRQLLASQFLSAPVFAGVKVLERVIPESTLLQRAYDLIIGAYIQKGWREGLKIYQAVSSLPEWDSVSVK